jgi:hypothetical protein
VRERRSKMIDIDTQLVDQAWKVSGLCAQADPDSFFPP